MMRAWLAVLVAVLVAGTVSAMGPPKIRPNLASLPYIKCGVCHHMVQNAYAEFSRMKEEETPSKPATELALISMLERLTTAWRDEGEWITKLSVERGKDDQVVVEVHNRPGQCEWLCKTIEKAAFDAMGDKDTDLAEALLSDLVGASKGKGKKRAAPKNRGADHIAEWFCREEAEVCPPRPVPADEAMQTKLKLFEMPWTRRTSRDLDAMMGEMGDAGLRGSLYSRDELMEQMSELEDSIGGEDAGEGIAGPITEATPATPEQHEETKEERPRITKEEINRFMQMQSMATADEALRQIDLAERRYKGDYPLYEGDPEDDETADEAEVEAYYEMLKKANDAPEKVMEQEEGLEAVQEEPKDEL